MRHPLNSNLYSNESHKSTHRSGHSMPMVAGLKDRLSQARSVATGDPSRICQPECALIWDILCLQRG